MAVNYASKDRLTRREQQAIIEFLTRLRAKYRNRVLEAILFGSKARGDSIPGSDIDILLIVDSDEWRFQHAISDLASDVSLEYDVLIGPRVIAHVYWRELARSQFSLYENVAREGIPLPLEPV